MLLLKRSAGKNQRLVMIRAFIVSNIMEIWRNLSQSTRAKRLLALLFSLLARVKCQGNDSC